MVLKNIRSSGMGDPDTSKRGMLIRNVVVFQLKLMADGFRDLVLLPVSLIATIIGLLRGGNEPEREFLQVIDLGRESERWINLFGSYDVSEDASAATSIDVLLAKVETTLKQHYKASGTSASAQAEIGEALQAAHDEVSQQPSEQ